MDLSKKNSEIIEWLLLPRNKKLLEYLRYRKEKESSSDPEISKNTLSGEDILKRSVLSEKDIKYGRTTSHEELDREIDNW